MADKTQTGRIAPPAEKEAGLSQQQQMAEMNEALLIAGLRQHELTEAAEKLNQQLQSEIAERKRLQQAKFFLASIVEGSQDSIISIDFNQTITSWNKGAERLYGYPAEEAIGKSTTMLTLPEDLRAVWARIDVIKRGGTVETFEVERVQKQGGHLWVSVTLSVVRDDAGRPVGISTISRDITEQRRLEQELRIAKAKLERRAEHLEEVVIERTSKLTESIRFLEELNYTMAHDLRTPVRAMRAFAIALLEDVPLNDLGKNYAERISIAAQRMDQLVNDLMEYSQLTHSQFPIQPVDLEKEIAKVITNLSEEIEAAHADVQVNGPMPIVSGNETLVQQIASNFLLNAVKFVAPGVTPKVAFRTEVRDSVVRLWVEDNGIGISASHQRKIFGVFQRLHAIEEFPGTGVGLAIIKTAAERMGGAVGVESEHGKGSRFWVEFRKAE